MNYVVLFTGAGEGCDYTIGCNRDWQFYNCETLEELKEQINEYYDDHSGEDTIEEVEIYEVTDCNYIWKEMVKEKAEKERKEKELAKKRKAEQKEAEEKELFEKLSKKYGK